MDSAPSPSVGKPKRARSLREQDDLAVGVIGNLVAAAETQLPKDHFSQMRKIADHLAELQT